MPVKMKRPGPAADAGLETLLKRVAEALARAAPRPVKKTPPGPAADAGLETLLKRGAEALERAAPPPAAAPNFVKADAYVWRADQGRLQPVARVNRVELALLRGIDRVRDALVENTTRFAKGLPANNALLWGARGMGKSSLVKAVHAEINRTARS